MFSRSRKATLRFLHCRVFVSSAASLFLTFSDQTKNPGHYGPGLCADTVSRRQAAEFSAAFIWASSFLAGS